MDFKKTSTELRDAIHGKFFEYLIEKGLIPDENFNGTITCLNPEHEDNHPSMGVYRKGFFPRLQCFSCGAKMDIFNLIQLLEKDEKGNPVAHNFKEALNWAATHWNLRHADSQKQKISRTPAKKPAETKINYSDFTAEFKIANTYVLKNPKLVEHLKKTRGLSDKQIKRYMGYVPQEYGVNGLLQNQPAHRIKDTEGGKSKILLFFPDENGKMLYFQARRVGDKNEEEAKYINPAGSKRPFFQEHLLKNPPEVLIITEGIYDALACQRLNEVLNLPEGFMDVIALGGSDTFANRFIELVRETSPKLDTCFMIATDNDPAGEKAANTLIGHLEKLGYPTFRFSLDGVKDPDEAWLKEQENFVSTGKSLLENAPARSHPEQLEKYLTELKERKAKENQAKKEAYLKKYSAYYLVDELFERIQNSKNYEPISTDFGPLDDLLGGGFHPETYVLAAQPSVGKSALTLQFIDTLAKQGLYALLFTLEMSADQQMLRSLSRLTFEISQKRTGGDTLAKSSRELSVYSEYSRFSDQELTTISEAYEEYYTFNDHVLLFEGSDHMTTDAIQKRVDEFMELCGERCVVFIDYLQILRPDEKNLTPSAKLNTDYVVSFVKQLSTQYNIPVFCIASLNRAGYDKLGSNAALKESGSQEYTFENIFFLEDPNELEAKGNKDENKYLEYEHDRDARSADGKPVNVRLRMTKQRNSGKGEVHFKYYRKYNCFEAVDSPESRLTQSNSKSEKVISQGGRRKGDKRL